MVTTCCVLGCATRAKTGSGIGFFRFPKHDPERRQQWIRAVRRRNWEPTENDRVCGEHFLQGQPCHTHKNHPDWIPSLFSFTQRNRELEARNLKRFERSLKRLRRLAVRTTSSPAPNSVPSNSTSNSEFSSKPSSMLPAQGYTVRGHFPTSAIPGMPTPAFVVNSDGSVGSTCTTTVKGPTFLLCSGAGIPRLVNQESATNQVVILLGPGVSPTAIAPTTTVMSNNTPIVHHVVGSTQLGSSGLQRVAPALEGSEQERAAPQIRVTNVWSTASDTTLSATEEEDERAVVVEGNTNEQILPTTEGNAECLPDPLDTDLEMAVSEDDDMEDAISKGTAPTRQIECATMPWNSSEQRAELPMPGREQLETAGALAETSPRPRIVDVWSAASDSTLTASEGDTEATGPAVHGSSTYSLDEPDYILPCTEMPN
ncbi:uncharacterized protein [Dermacentor andersoni]|uniref:uncharacterized protein isoform X2 n=1 Tax=Dermacentor andersoni TaxID=34620 RepID=UPI002155E8B1|nr:uncharacterized protein LOC126528343 isoform X2 [Dermacentor andersoni]